MSSAPRARAADETRRTGWSAFALWAVPGVALGLQVSAVGVLLLPLGAVATVLVRGAGERPTNGTHFRACRTSSPAIYTG